MPAPRKYDDSTMEQAVGMYLDRQRSHPGESKIESRRQVGALLDIHHATLRNWVEARERADGTRPAASAADEVVDMDEVRRLRRELVEVRRANEILKTSAAFFAQAELDRRLR